ncbi:ROK family transcriptional regulator [Streptomyces sp. NPDC005402]|uniref:ROK family transcriptional regulator n=1 Tax=Streptomyces sp. NPDC005402 TaxID=3155338 RepID=UPI0033B1CDC6
MAVRNGRTVRDLRRGNRAAVLQRLYFDGPMSRFELAPATGLSGGSISNVVAELVEDGLVEEAGTVESDGGRPRTLLRVAPAGGHMIGVDVGETRVRVELFDLTLTELARTERPLAHHGYDVEVVVGHIRDGIAEVLADADITPEQLLGVGIGVPGIVAHTPEQGAVVHGQTMGWNAVPLESLLRSTCELPASVPYFIDNGARTLGQAELWFGAGRGSRNAVVVLFGSGIGACLVTEGVEYGRALEWGHVTVQVRGRRCRCGALGCLEAYAGAGALIDRWREAGGHPPEDADEETALAALLAAAGLDGGAGGGSGGGAGGASGEGAGGASGEGAGDGLSEGTAADPGQGTEAHPREDAEARPAREPAAHSGEGTAAHPDQGVKPRPGEGAQPDPGKGATPHPVQPPEADPVALAVLEETAEYVGAGLSDLVNLFQPERILIGGWAGLQLGPRFLPAVRRYADAYSLRHPAERVTIDLGKLGPDAVTVGAASLTLADFFARGGRPAARRRDHEGANGG